MCLVFVSITVLLDEVHSLGRAGEDQYTVRDAESGESKQDYLQGVCSSRSSHFIVPIAMTFLSGYSRLVRRGCSGLVSNGGGRYRSGSLS
jgi:hypothetical protein